MPSGPTYYDFFGISPAASPDQIRSAYLALMKNCHPDRADQTDKRRASDFAAFVNRSYDVLRDPAKRARYDAYLTRQSRSEQKTQLRRRRLLAGQTLPGARRRLDRSSIGVAILACAIAFIVVGALLVPSTFAPRLLASTEPAAAPLPSAHDTIPPRDIHRQVRQAMSSLPEEALLASEDCFRSARNQASLRQTELCIMFDDAYLDWSQIADEDLPQSVYFNETILRVRHRNAMAIVGSFGEGRLDELRRAALSVLLLEIRSRVDDQARLAALPLAAPPVAASPLPDDTSAAAHAPAVPLRD